MHLTERTAHYHLSSASTAIRPLRKHQIDRPSARDSICQHVGTCRAMQQKDHSAALQQYTQALDATPPPPPAFAAVLHSNRASVHLAKSNLLEAVADAGRAHALNPAYAKV